MRERETRQDLVLDDPGEAGLDDGRVACGRSARGPSLSVGTGVRDTDPSHLRHWPPADTAL